jgi:hypothetical protein
MSRETQRLWAELHKDRLREYARAWTAKNRDRVREYQRAYDSRNPGRQVGANRTESIRRAARRNKLKTKYSLTLEAFDAILLAQANRCDVCGMVFGKGWTELPCVDHSHTTGHVRALLCRKCNLALGHANDSPKLLRQLADYLERHQ